MIGLDGATFLLSPCQTGLNAVKILEEGYHAELISTPVPLTPQDGFNRNRRETGETRYMIFYDPKLQIMEYS